MKYFQDISELKKELPKNMMVSIALIGMNEGNFFGYNVEKTIHTQKDLNVYVDKGLPLYLVDEVGRFGIEPAYQHFAKEIYPKHRFGEFLVFCPVSPE